MREDAFRSWLSNSRGYGNGTVSSRVSNCKTIERSEGDLDQHFDQDHLRGLVKRLTYSKEYARLDENQSVNALALDDNVYRNQLWSFVFRGAQFSKFGPAGYALAHLADHKDHGNRFGQDFEVTEVGDGARPLFGLYTCPSNTVYTPVSLIKPTDFVGTIRALLVRRAQQLYGEFCKILPPFLGIPEPFSPEWNVSEFKWADPVGTTNHIQGFLTFRNDRLAKLINAAVPR